jgi:SAM-dependent methyltransferase
MYAPSYFEHSAAGDLIGDSRDPEPVLEVLRRSAPGRFLDYGCGDGTLLELAATEGWSVQGVEFGQDVADEVASRTGHPVVPVGDVDTMPGQAFDVVHLGDVIEHLTNPDHEMPRILGLVKPGGLLVAQGPLEAQASLFVLALRCGRRLRADAVAQTPPYHVSLATIRGQSALFRRFGLTEATFRVSEVAWPAPERLNRQMVKRPRLLALYTIRRASQTISRMSPKPSGNRYLYVGRVE